MVGAVKEHMDYDLTTLDMLCCDWVKAMDVQMYMRVSDKIDATLGDKELSMPEKTIMDYDFATCRGHHASRFLPKANNLVYNYCIRQQSRCPVRRPGSRPKSSSLGGRRPGGWGTARLPAERGVGWEML